MKKNRILYLDYLRIITTISVIMLHVAMRYWGNIPVTYSSWKVLNVVACAVRWCVAVFVMISGALFLDNAKPLDTKKLYCVNIVRIITAFLFWTSIYAFDKFLHGEEIETVIGVAMQGNYHLWFLYMLLGLYVLVPLLRKITEDKRATEYFLGIGFVFTFLIPQAIDLLSRIDYPIVRLLVENFSSVLASMEFHFTLGYVYYFVLGFYIVKYDIPVAFQRIGYALGMISFCATVALTDWYSVRIGKASTEFLSNISINILMMAVGMLLTAKYVLSKLQCEGKLLNGILHISKCSFGIYLVHALILDIVGEGLDRNDFITHPIASTLGLVVGTAVISYAISAILNRIPVLKKYVV